MNSIIIRVITLLLSTLIYCQGSWPIDEFRIIDDPPTKEKIENIISKYDNINFKYLKFEYITIRQDLPKKIAKVTVCISYYQVSDWNSKDYNDVSSVNHSDWKARPANIDSVNSGVHADVVSLYAKIEEMGYKPRKSSYVKMLEKEHELLAAWNFLDIDIPLDKKSDIIELLIEYFGAYSDKEAVVVYGE